MSKCFQNFSMFDFPTPYFPDDLLPLIKTEQEQQERSELTPMGEELIPANLDIILSKLLNNDALNDIELQQLSEQQRLAMVQVQQKIEVTKKRSDQYQKLFYRRAFKFAQRQFFGKRCKNKSRKMSSFYHFYFGNTAQKMNIPLLNFYHPNKKTRPGLKVGQKSFNKSYIRLLLRSETFREVSRSYRGKFVSECIQERDKKISKFSKYLKGLITVHHKDSLKIAQIIRSNKCKVPWSNLDIGEADRRASEDLQNYNFQFSQSSGDELQNEESMSCSQSE